MTRRRRSFGSRRHKQRQMLVLIQISLLVGILAIVILFRDKFGILTSSFVSAFDAQDVQVQKQDRVKSRVKSNVADKKGPDVQGAEKKRIAKD